MITLWSKKSLNRSLLAPPERGRHAVVIRLPAVPYQERLNSRRCSRHRGSLPGNSVPALRVAFQQGDKAHRTVVGPVTHLCFSTHLHFVSMASQEDYDATEVASWARLTCLDIRPEVKPQSANSRSPEDEKLGAVVAQQQLLWDVGQVSQHTLQQAELRFKSTDHRILYGRPYNTASSRVNSKATRPNTRKLLPRFVNGNVTQILTLSTLRTRTHPSALCSTPNRDRIHCLETCQKRIGKGRPP